jgi:hypothetical protein
MTHPSPVSKISFPPIVVKFSGDQQSSIKEITDDLISNWKNQHGIDLILTARSSNNFIGIGMKKNGYWSCSRDTFLFLKSHVCELKMDRL